VEWYHVWWPWLTSERVARFVSDSWVSCSFYHYCHVFRYSWLWVMACQVVILFSWVWAPPQKKNLKFCSWSCAFYCILSNNPILMQISWRMIRFWWWVIRHLCHGRVVTIERFSGSAIMAEVCGLRVLPVKCVTLRRWFWPYAENSTTSHAWRGEPVHQNFF